MRAVARRRPSADRFAAALIGLARVGDVRSAERTPFVHKGGVPVLHVYEAVLLALGQKPG